LTIFFHFFSKKHKLINFYFFENKIGFLIFLKKIVFLKMGSTNFTPPPPRAGPSPEKNLAPMWAVGDTFMPKTSVIKNTKPKVHVKLGANL
jgi:hypothetical protein